MTKSSEKGCMLNKIEWERQLRKMRNKSWTSTLPWGTPEHTSQHADVALLTALYWDLSVRNLVIHLIIKGFNMRHKRL